MAELFDEQFDDDRSSTRSALMTSVNATRDSNISVSKFNRWVVGEQNLKSAEEGRKEMAMLKSARGSAQDSHRQYGASLAAASRAQIQRDRQQCESLRQSNLSKGKQVRDDVASQKEEAQRLKQEWVDYGRKLAEKDAEQRRKIREVCGEGSKRVQDIVAQCKEEEEEFEAYLEQRRAQILKSNQEEVQRVKAETAAAVTDAAKQFALDQRRSLASKTKDAKSSWEKEHKKKTEEHLRAAKANAEEARARKEKTKALRDKITAQRQKDAAATRELQKRNKLARDQFTLESGQATGESSMRMIHTSSTVFAPAARP